MKHLAQQGRTLQSGFTLIELMIVVAIIGILAAVAVPQYKTYIGRAMVTEALSASDIVKTAFEEYVQTTGHFPPGPTVTATDIGLPSNNNWTGTFVTIVSGFNIASFQGFQLELGNTGNSEIDGKVIYFLAKAIGGNLASGLVWQCTVGGGPTGLAFQPIAAKYVPSTCRVGS